VCVLLCAELFGPMERGTTVTSACLLASFSRGLSLAVVVAALEKANSVVLHQADQTMLFADPTRPDIRRPKLQRLRLPDPAERIGHDRFYELKRPKRELSILFDQPREVFAELAHENCVPVLP